MPPHSHLDELLGAAWPPDVQLDEPYPVEDVEEMQSMLDDLVRTLAD
jgi:hypothetical protein